MILASKHGNRELRGAGEWGTEHLIPWPGTVGYVSTEAAYGLPAVGNAIRLYAGTIASLPLCVWQGEGADRKKRDDTWQYKLFEFPNDEVSAYTFKWDIVSALESCGNAFVFKARMRRTRRVGALATLQPQNMTVRRDQNTGELIYEFWDGRQTKRIPTEDVLHIRGDTLGGGDIGVSPIHAHAHALSNSLKRENFEGSYYANDAKPGVALIFPHGVTSRQAEEWRESWDRNHAGGGNRGRTGVLGGGATIQTFPLSLEDQQFVESQRFSVQDVARMYDMPATLLEEGDAQSSEQEWLRWLKSGLHSRLTRIERALRFDPDLFGPRERLYPEFDPDMFMRTDAATMAEVAHKKVQSGIWLLDEARAKEGLPNLPDGAGQVPQMVPVGGQANPGAQPPQE